MNLKNMSNAGLNMMHGAIHRAIAKDDNTPPGAPKPFGVRTFADWREWATWLEAELAARKADFVTVRWW